MTSTTASGEQYNPITGEIIETPAEQGTTPALPVQATSTSLGRELDQLPAEFGQLAAFFEEPEPDVRDVVAWIMGHGEMEQTDPEDSARAILARILSAETSDQLLVGHRVVHAKEILNIPLEVRAVKWQRSAYEEGGSVYAVITATPLGSETPQTITCGGRNVMMQLLNASHRGFLPLRCMITEASKPTEAGYRPLWLEPA